MLGGLGRQKWDGWSWYGVGEPKDGCGGDGTAFGVGAPAMAPADPETII